MPGDGDYAAAQQVAQIIYFVIIGFLCIAAFLLVIAVGIYYIAVGLVPAAKWLAEEICEILQEEGGKLLFVPFHGFLVALVVYGFWLPDLGVVFLIWVGYTIVGWLLVVMLHY